jgi:carboxylesterase
MSATLIIVIRFLIVATVWWITREFIARREERRFLSRFTHDPDGIIVGAQPITLRGTRPGAVLLLHGYNDSPQSMASVAAAFHARGWTVRVPLLPGHGRSLAAFDASRADQWLQAGRAELDALLATHGAVAVGGLSMGGAISFALAATNPDVRAVVAFAPFLRRPVPAPILKTVARIATLGGKYVWAGGSRSVHDPAAGATMIAYGRSTPRLLVELDQLVRTARAELPRVRQPVLVVQSREDNRIPEAAATEAFGLIGSADKTLHWTSGNGHVVTVDYGHESLEQFAADWLESRLA